MRLVADRIISGQFDPPSPRALDDLPELPLERRFPPSSPEQQDRARLDRLWSHLMDIDDWTLLSKALSDSQAGSSLGKIEKGGDPGMSI